MSLKSPPSRKGTTASSWSSSSTRIRGRAQDGEWIELDRDEYENVLAYRARRRHAAETENPAIGLSLELTDLPKFALLSAPAIWTRLAQVKNVLEVVFCGFTDIEGNRHRLSPSASIVLLFIMAVKFKLKRVVGELDPVNLAEFLGYSPRTTRGALRELEELCLVEISRRRGAVDKVVLVDSLMDVPLRERRSYPQGESRRHRFARARQISADHISERPGLDENPLPLRGAPPPAPAAPIPQTPCHGEEETDRRGRLAATPSIVETAAARAHLPDPPHPVEAAVSPSNGDKRQRLQGANDHSRGAPVPSWWRSLLARTGLGGPAPPS